MVTPECLTVDAGVLTVSLKARYMCWFKKKDGTMTWGGGGGEEGTEKACILYLIFIASSSFKNFKNQETPEKWNRFYCWISIFLSQYTFHLTCIVNGCTEQRLTDCAAQFPKYIGSFSSLQLCSSVSCLSVTRTLYESMFWCMVIPLYESMYRCMAIPL